MTEDNSCWTFLSNYAHVLMCVAENPEIRLRDIAVKVDITERSTQRILNHLKEAGILIANRTGRRNYYMIDVDQQLRHPIESHCSIATLLQAVFGKRMVAETRKNFEQRPPGLASPA